MAPSSLKIWFLQQLYGSRASPTPDIHRPKELSISSFSKYLQECGTAGSPASPTEADPSPFSARARMLFRVDGVASSFPLPFSPDTLPSYVLSHLLCFESLLLGLRCHTQPVRKLTHHKIPVAINSEQFFDTSNPKKTSLYFMLCKRCHLCGLCPKT